MDKLTYSRPEAATRLGVSVQTLDKQRKAGKIPFLRIGGRILYNAEQIDRLATGRKAAQS